MGPILYRQVRVGRDGRPFTLYKFRTMRPDAERETGPVWSGPDDPRVTPFGRRLRRWHLDEIPQIINVLRGEMRLVGPRPERPEFAADLRARLPRYDERLSVPPGITGLAQARGGAGITPRQKLRYDLLYIRRRGWRMDLWIVWLTLIRGIRGWPPPRRGPARR